MSEYGWIITADGREVYRRLDRGLPPARSGLPCPMIISDQMDETEHPCDGKLYTSKRAFRRTTKENGCIEIGNDPARFKTPKRPDDSKGIEQAIDKALALV
jgi:hypothetical protein